MNLFVGLTRSFAGLSILAVILAALLVPAVVTSRGRGWLSSELLGRERILLGIAWIVAAIAMGGSLYFSEVVGFTPCLYCWYQRIAMYPMVLILAIAFVLRDGRIWRYLLPLSAIGLLLSTYHVTIELRPSLAVGSCDAAAPCTVRLFAILGFISIPVMAGSAFLLIVALMLVLRSVENEGRTEGSL
jgi:disulfide bond formation protein DsbB